jgi:rubrerythrin
VSERTTDHMDTDERGLATLKNTTVSRRRFLAGTGVAAGLAVATVACGNDKKDAGATGGGSQSSTPTTAQGPSDVDVAALAAGLEKLAVDTYGAALAAATAGKLGTVPPAVAEFVTTAQKQHQEHLDAWNKVLSGAGKPEVNAPNAKYKGIVDPMLTSAKTVVDAANLALTLEDIAAQTYLKAIPDLKSKDAVQLAAQIQVVDQQHQAILRYALGLYPVGSGTDPSIKDFQPTDKAAS